MVRYPYSFRRRVRLSLKRLLLGTIGWIRAIVRRPYILLVTGDATHAKADEVEARLRFLLAHLEGELDIRRSLRASPLQYLSCAGVAVADGLALPQIAGKLPWVADLDFDSNPWDGWRLMDLGTALSRGSRRRFVEDARQVFLEHVRHIQADGPRPVYLFGTGPSLRFAAGRSFADGVTIVCNTIVRDPELWHHLQPAFFAAGDPIYYFGHNPHARAFRADALQRLRESDGRTLFVYPAVFDVLVRPEFRAIESMLVPIPRGGFGGHADVTVDLTRRFCLPDDGNVLNGLLLPLGCTVGRDVRLWGFDGRAPGDQGFWANSGRHAYADLIPSIRAAHPAFFAHLVPPGDEVRYVNRVHGEWLDARLAEAESRGFQFTMLHHSWTATLEKRYR